MDHGLYGQDLILTVSLSIVLIKLEIKAMSFLYSILVIYVI